MKINTHKTCDCGNEFKLYRTTQKYCSAVCEKNFKGFNTKVKKVSEKTVPLLREYSKLRIEFFEENKLCFICSLPANTIEHRKGRKGKDDQGIPMLISVKYWAACCNKCNLELENNTELSKKYQLSKNHNEKKGFLK